MFCPKRFVVFDYVILAYARVIVHFIECFFHGITLPGIKRILCDNPGNKSACATKTFFIVAPH